MATNSPVHEDESAAAAEDSAASRDTDSRTQTTLAHILAYSQQLQNQVATLQATQAVTSRSSVVPKDILGGFQHPWKTEGFRWQFRFNSDLRDEIAECEELAFQLAGPPASDVLSAKLLALKEKLQHRNVDLLRADSHPGYLKYADEHRMLKKLSADDDDGVWASFLKERKSSGPVSSLRAGSKRPFPGASGPPPSVGGNFGFQPFPFPAQVPAVGGITAFSQLSRRPVCGSFLPSHFLSFQRSVTPRLALAAAAAPMGPGRPVLAVAAASAPPLGAVAAGCKAPAGPVGPSATGPASVPIPLRVPQPPTSIPTSRAACPGSSPKAGPSPGPGSTAERLRTVFASSEGEMPKVKGSLFRHLSFWESIGAPASVLSVIKHGYALPIRPDITVPRLHLANNRSALQHRDFVSCELRSLLDSGSIRKVPGRPHVVSPLSVATNTAKLRLILDLSVFNGFLDTPKVKYETLDVIRDLLPRDGFMGKFDMKSGYHHLDIRQADQTYLGFSWDLGNGPEFFVFTVLPFGLSTAPYLFTKFFRPLVHHWRSRGFLCALYLDDGFFWAASRADAQRCSDAIQADLAAGGVLTSPDKCLWWVQQILIWLGIQIDLASFSLAITEKRLESTLILISSLLAESSPSIRDRLRFTGKVISMAAVIGPIVQLKTRRIYEQVNLASGAYGRRVPLTSGEVTELMFWLANLRLLNFCSLSDSAGACRLVCVPSCLASKACLPTSQSGEGLVPEVAAVAGRCASRAVSGLVPLVRTSGVTTVATDASSLGLGAVLYDVAGAAHRVSSVALDSTDCLESSTFRELKAVLFALKSFASHVSGQTVKLQTDNQNVVSIVLKGSRVPKLQTLAEQIFATSVSQRCFLEPIWVPRDLNSDADEASRLADFDDWGVRSQFFKICDDKWGPHTIDRFADHLNSFLPRFNSRVFVPGTAGVDAFSFPWGGDMNWLCPPISAVSRTLKYMSQCRAHGTLAVPEWSSQPWFALLRPDGEHWASFVRDFVRMPAGTVLFRPAAQELSTFNSQFSQFPFLFLLLDFSS